MSPNYDYFLTVTTPLTVKSKPNLNPLLCYCGQKTDFVESNQLSVVSMMNWAPWRFWDKMITNLGVYVVKINELIAPLHSSFPSSPPLPRAMVFATDDSDNSDKSIKSADSVVKSGNSDNSDNSNNSNNSVNSGNSVNSLNPMK